MMMTAGGPLLYRGAEVVLSARLSRLIVLSLLTVSSTCGIRSGYPRIKLGVAMLELTSSKYTVGTFCPVKLQPWGDVYSSPTNKSVYHA